MRRNEQKIGPLRLVLAGHAGGGGMAAGPIYKSPSREMFQKRFGRDGTVKWAIRSVIRLPARKFIEFSARQLKPLKSFGGLLAMEHCSAG
jgi:hypothetical protein